MLKVNKLNIISVINSTWSQLDLEKNERTKFQRTLVFDTDKQVKLVHSGRSVPVRNKYLELFEIVLKDILKFRLFSFFNSVFGM